MVAATKQQQDLSKTRLGLCHVDNRHDIVHVHRHATPSGKSFGYWVYCVDRKCIEDDKGGVPYDALASMASVEDAKLRAAGVDLAVTRDDGSVIKVVPLEEALARRDQVNADHEAEREAKLRAATKDRGQAFRDLRRAMGGRSESVASYLRIEAAFAAFIQADIDATEAGALWYQDVDALNDENDPLFGRGSLRVVETAQRALIDPFARTECSLRRQPGHARVLAYWRLWATLENAWRRREECQGLDFLIEGINGRRDADRYGALLAAAEKHLYRLLRELRSDKEELIKIGAQCAGEKLNPLASREQDVQHLLERVEAFLGFYGEETSS